MQDDFHTAFTTMSEAIYQAFPGKPQWFRLFMDNLVYKPVVSKSAKQLKELLGVRGKTSPCAYLSDETLSEMIRLMTLITEQLQAGEAYATIKERVVAEVPIPPAFTVQISENTSKRYHARSTVLPRQLCLPGLGDDELRCHCKCSDLG